MKVKLIDKIRLDLEANSGNRKGIFIVVFYRIANYFYKSRFLIVRLTGIPLRKLYHVICKWIMGVEIPEQTEIGCPLVVWHGQGIVINQNSRIGNNVLIRHSTTIGNKYQGSGCPIIGNNVDIGAHVVIIGDIKIGDNVVIGAGTIVTKSLPANCVAFGNPLVLRFVEHDNIDKYESTI